MRAIQVEEFGDPSVLKLVSGLPVPSTSDDQVVICQSVFGLQITAGLLFLSSDKHM